MDYGWRYFVLRDPKTGEPYTGGHMSSDRLKLPDGIPFHQIRASDLYHRIKKEIRPSGSA